MNKGAIVLTSGGLDSTTCLAIAHAQGYTCYTLAFDYGQRNQAELIAARTISALFGAKEHKVLTLPIGSLGGSSLTDTSLEIPEQDGTSIIPTTYVPARNTIFLSMALAWAEILRIYDIFIGVSAVDFSNYPDCRPEFIAQFQTLAALATKEGVEGHPVTIHTPLLHLSKAETIQRGLALGIDYSQTISCYRATSAGKACGTCASCTLRKKGFQGAQAKDVTHYVEATS